MKTKLAQKRFKAHKRSSCALCKPYKKGWEGKRKIAEQREAIGHEQQIKELLSQ